jgi:hypothetical protein
MTKEQMADLALRLAGTPAYTPEQLGCFLFREHGTEKEIEERAFLVNAAHRDTLVKALLAFALRVK